MHVTHREVCRKLLALVAGLVSGVPAQVESPSRFRHPATHARPPCPYPHAV